MSGTLACSSTDFSTVYYGAGDKTKAVKAAKEVKKSQVKRTKKIRLSTTFRHTKTQTQQRNPKYPRVRCVDETRVRDGRLCRRAVEMALQARIPGAAAFS